jgi:hypothetical protein
MRRKEGFSSLRRLKWLWRAYASLAISFLFFSLLFYNFGLLFSFLFSLLLMCDDLRRTDISKNAANELDITPYTKLI